jgi:hypothetical protein
MIVVVDYCFSGNCLLCEFYIIPVSAGKLLILYAKEGSIFSTFREGKVPTFLSISLIFYFLFHLFPPNILYLFTLSLFILPKVTTKVWNLKVENI